MGRPKKPSPPVRTAEDAIRAILAANVKRHMAQIYRDEPNVTAQTSLLAKATGISQETIRRIITMSVSAGIDKVQLLAIGLGTTAPELLQPYKPAAAQEEDHVRRQG